MKSHLVNAEGENTSSAGAGISSSVAETIIARIEARIEGVLALAEKYNITIPENLTILIDEAKSLLVNASGMVEEAPDKVIRLAILVARKFKPVAV